MLKFIKIILNPNFLQSIDQKFLLNYPRLWTSRIHYLIYYSIICSIFQLLLFNRIKINFDFSLNVSIMFLVFGFAFLIIGYWFYQQLVYQQNFKILNQYGIIQPYWECLKDFILNLVCFLISACPFILLVTIITTKTNTEAKTTNNAMCVFYFTLFCIFCYFNLFLFFRKYTDFKHLLLSLLLLLAGLMGIVIFTDMLVGILSLTDTSQISFINKLIIIIIASALIFTAFLKNQDNSFSSHINLILLPYMVALAAICLVSLIEDKALTWLTLFSMLNSLNIFDALWIKKISLYLLSSIAFVPFLPYLANQFIQRLSSPKEI